MIAKKFMAEVRRIMDEVEETQMASIAKAADLMTDCIVAGNRVFIFGCSHAAILSEEMIYRAGGLAVINPIFAPGLSLDQRPLNRTSKLERLEGFAKIIVESSPMRRGDLLIVASTSGRNAVPIEMALEAKKIGVTVIAMTSLAYSTPVTSRHSSGKKLYEVADLVLDNCGVLGDAVLAVEGLKQKICGTSNIMGALILHSIVAETVERLIKKGKTPPVFTSGNLDGGFEANAHLFEEYKDRIFYM